MILVAEPDGYTHAIAKAIAHRMRSGGHRVDVSDALGGCNPAPDHYDAVILGTEAGRHRDRRLIGDYISSHRRRLQELPTGLFVLCSSRSSRRDPRHFIEAFETRVGWRAKFAAAFSYGPMGATTLLRRILSAWLRRIDGTLIERDVRELAALTDALSKDLAVPRP